MRMCSRINWALKEVKTEIYVDPRVQPFLQTKVTTQCCQTFCGLLHNFYQCIIGTTLTSSIVVWHNNQLASSRSELDPSKLDSPVNAKIHIAADEGSADVDRTLQDNCRKAKQCADYRKTHDRWQKRGIKSSNKSGHKTGYNISDRKVMTKIVAKRALNYETH